METKGNFLGVPIVKGFPEWKSVGYNFLEFVLFFLAPAILFLHFVEGLEVSNVPFYKGLLAAIIGLVVQHVVKFYGNKWVKMSFYNKYLNILYLLVILIGAFALFEIWGM